MQKLPKSIISIKMRPDWQQNDWVARHIPWPLQPYLRLMRIERPIGIWLLLLPCWWGMALAARAGEAPLLGPDGWMTGATVQLALLFAGGAVVMRSAGCVINDMIDRNQDAKVARTALRPLASGVITMRQAMALLAILLLAGMMILLEFNRPTVHLGLASLLPVLIYPLMKRITYWPQAFLGLTFNWGALMGWTAVTGSLALPALALYGAGVFWTLYYDTIYAHQDKEDDIFAGVKSTALLLADKTKPWLVGFGALFIGLFGLAGWLGGLGYGVYLGLLPMAALMAWQIAALKLDQPEDCLRHFKRNRWMGWLGLLAMIAGQLTLF